MPKGLIPFPCSSLSDRFITQTCFNTFLGEFGACSSCRKHLPDRPRQPPPSPPASLCERDRRLFTNSIFSYTKGKKNKLKENIPKHTGKRLNISRERWNTVCQREIKAKKKGKKKTQTNVKLWKSEWETGKMKEKKKLIKNSPFMPRTIPFTSSSWKIWPCSEKYQFIDSSWEEMRRGIQYWVCIYLFMLNLTGMCKYGEQVVFGLFICDSIPLWMGGGI